MIGRPVCFFTIFEQTYLPMKRLFLLFVFAALVSCTHEEGWKLVWTEDFNGPSIDENV